jgi:hypothetical protein
VAIKISARFKIVGGPAQRKRRLSKCLVQLHGIIERRPALNLFASRKICIELMQMTADVAFFVFNTDGQRTFS